MGPGHQTVDSGKHTKNLTCGRGRPRYGYEGDPEPRSLGRGDFVLQDKVLQFLLENLEYVDNLPPSVLSREVQQLQRELFPSIKIQP